MAVMWFDTYWCLTNILIDGQQLRQIDCFHLYWDFSSTVYGTLLWYVHAIIIRDTVDALTYRRLVLLPDRRCVQPVREEVCSLPSQMPVRRWWSWGWPSLRSAGACRVSYCTTLTLNRPPTATKLQPSVSQTWQTSGHDSLWALHRI